MSRVGNKPIPVPSGAKVEVSGNVVKATGPKGNLSLSVVPTITAKIDGANVVVSRGDDLKKSRALHGLTRALLANMIEGVTKGYSQTLEVYGTGYTCKVEGTNLMLNVGFMGRGFGKPAQFIIPIPAGLKVNIDAPAARGENEPAKFTVTGIDKQLIGNFCAEVRKIRKPEPYKGKGIRYAGEPVRRKVGKQFAGGG